MKREHHLLNPQPDPNSLTAASTSCGKSKLWDQDQEGQQEGAIDELLAVLGYKVRSSDMAEVAQKLEQLEEFMCNVHEDGLSHLASGTVHYNPSDLSTWLESMLSELNPPTQLLQLDSNSFIAPAESSTITSVDLSDLNEKQYQHQNQSPQVFEQSSSSDYSLELIPGNAIYRKNKRLKPSTMSDLDQSFYASSFRAFETPLTDDSTSSRPVVLVDSQENGIRLVHSLLGCAEAVHQNKLDLAEALVKRIRYLAVSQAGAMGKVATFFAEALACRIYRLYPDNLRLDNSLLQMHFYESCPYLKFAHFTANQAILEAFEGKNRVHVIDFSMNQGMQWPALMQALALRPGGPPAFRLTGIGPPAEDKSDHLQEVGWKLAQLAETIHVEFEYRGFVANSLADLDASILELRPSEVESVAVNSVFELHKLLARPGAIDKVLSVVKQIKPDIVTIVEQEANHNGSVFLDRFTESLHYYSTLFDSLESSVGNQDKLMSEMYLGKQICNVVACEGVERVERHETLTQWRDWLSSAGFVPVHLGSNAFKQASMLLALFGSGDGYRVEENNGSLMLGWHTRSLISTSAWQLGSISGISSLS